MADSILVTYDIDETPEERKSRIALKLPTPNFSFTVERENGTAERHSGQNQKNIAAPS